MKDNGHIYFFLENTFLGEAQNLGYVTLIECWNSKRAKQITNTLTNHITH